MYDVPRLTEPIEKNVQQLLIETFVETVNRCPQQQAVCQNGTSWNYQNLFEAAQSIAALLTENAASSGDVIAVHGGGSFGAISALLGVLVAGGVLLAIDDKLPAYRKQVMVEEADCSIVLNITTQQRLDWLKPEIAVLSLESDLKSLPLQAGVNLSQEFPEIAQESPAYIFFTSGTTGKPKGILGRHDSMAHFLNWQRKTFQIGSSDRHAQLTSLSFDVVLRDVFLPLSSGATLCLPPQNMHVASSSILGWLADEKITTLHTTPTLAGHWLGEMEGAKLPPLRYVFSAGEPLLANLVENWRHFFPNCVIVNLYGPTETTMAKFYYKVPENPVVGIQPLGRPLPQTQCLIMSEDGTVCPMGNEGEIVIRTPFRSYGYLNKTGDQRATFVKNKWRDDDSDLLYHTGDIGRLDSEGVLHFGGRLDDQVKILGQRVEPAEVTSQLLQNVDVAAAYTHPLETHNQLQLIAYIVTKKRVGLSAESLKLFLSERLPEVMIPSHFVFLDSLPLTVNGKIDRKKLPQPEFGKIQEKRAGYLAPRTDLEFRLARYWMKILRFKKIGVRDSFFELGGNSLQVVSLFDLIRKELGKSLLPDTIVKYPTIEELAKTIRKTGWEPSHVPLVKLQPKGDREPVFCFPGILGGVKYLLPLANYLGESQPFYGVRPQDLHIDQLPLLTIYDIAKNVVNEIRKVQSHGPYHLCGHSFGCVVAFEVAQQLLAAGEEIRFLAFLDYEAKDERLGFEETWVTRFYNYLLLKVYQTKAFFRYLEKMSRQGNKIPQQRKRFINLHVINRAALDGYSPKKIPCNITLFKAENTQSGNVGGLLDCTLKGVNVYIVPGDHNTMIEEPNVKVLAQKMTECLKAI